MGFVKAIWTGLDGLRKLLHLVLLIFLFGILLAGLSGEEVRVPDGAALILAPSGPLVEELTTDPIEDAIGSFSGAGPQQTVVWHVERALEAAADDARIEMVVLDLDAFAGGGLPNLRAVAAALETFQKSGKPVVATGSSYSQGSYYLAAGADEIYMHDFGSVFLAGLGSYQLYFADALEKLKLDIEVFRVGEYKSYVEPLLRNDMSDDVRAERAELLDELWTALVRKTESARGLDSGVLSDYSENYLSLLEDHDGDAGRLALEAGLVDELVNREQFRQIMIKRLGEAEDDEANYPQIGLASYFASLPLQDEASEGNVGVIVAAGMIVGGDGGAGFAGSQSLSERIQSAAQDDDIDALVLRVDSPGGGMFASELIVDALEQYRASGKPLVASMSNQATSGGYYIAVAADEIWANATSVTGSIGVGAVLPTFPRTLESLGISVDGVATTPIRAELLPERGLGDNGRRLIQLGVEDAYRKFIGWVARRRDTSSDAIDKVARGRVWTGAQAHELGLVDSLGTIHDAIASAASLAGLEDGQYSVRRFEPSRDLMEIISKRLASSSTPIGAWVRTLSDNTGTGKVMPDKVTEFFVDMARLAAANDPRGIFYYSPISVE